MSPRLPVGSRPALTRAIGRIEATALVVGTIIGTSIFVQPSEITREVSSVAGILLAWAIAGLLTFLGALVCAELASAFPQTGGVYVFLREAFSARVAFLWGWASFWSIHSGIIAAIAVVGARYLAVLAPVSPLGEQLLAAGIIAAISALNYVGVKPGTVVQTVVTGAKLAAIAVLLAAGLGLTGRGELPGGWAMGVADLATIPLDRLWLGVGAGLFAFGGWHMVTYAAGETRDPARTLPQALTVGVLVVTACYIGLNAVYLRVLPLDTVRASPRIAADVAERLMGPTGATAVAALVVLSAVGALAGIVLAGPRLYLSMADDGMMVPGVGAVHPRFRTPHRAILLQAAWSVVLVLTGSYVTLFNRVIYMEWFFFALMTLGVFVLRGRAGYQPSYRVWGYPLTPLVFVAASVAVVVTQIGAQPYEAFVGALVVASGWPVGSWISRRDAAA